MQNATIRTDLLRAVLHLAAKGDMRYYLNGVFFEVSENRTLLVATDGHAMGIAASAWGGNTLSENLIIARDVIEMALRAKTPEVVLQKRDDGTWQLGSVSFTPVDGKYPEWRHVVPKQCSGELQQFNPLILAKFAKSRSELSREKGESAGSSITLSHNGEAGALVSIGQDDEFFGVVMPRRGASDLKAPPAWALA
jgi:DNA polymerase-3 subunit beta